MKILLACPQSGDIADGYTRASNGMYDVFKKMQKEKLIDEIDIINIINDQIKIDKNILNKKYDIVFCTSYPPSMVANSKYFNFLKNVFKNCKKKYLSIVWETDTLPLSWDIIFKNSFFDGFLAPSDFVKTLLEKRTNKPIFKYPHYIEINKYIPINIKTKKNENKFRVLFCGQNTTRKGLRDAIISYTLALSKFEDCELIIKYTNLSDYEIDIGEQAKNSVFTNANIKNIKSKIILLHESLSNEKLNELYNGSAILLFPSRGEGFGLPPAEFMACGLPVIYTNWSACQEVCESPSNIPIPYHMDEAYNMAHFGYEEGSLYAIPSMIFLKKALRIMYDRWKTDTQKYYESSFKNREIINNKYGYKKIKENILYITNN